MSATMLLWLQLCAALSTASSAASLTESPPAQHEKCFMQRRFGSQALLIEEEGGPESAQPGAWKPFRADPGRHFEGCVNPDFRRQRQSPAATVSAVQSSSNSTRSAEGDACPEGSFKLVDFSSYAKTESCCPVGEIKCAGCAYFANSECKKCLGGFTRLNGRCVACANLEGYMDTNHRTCQYYAALGWCTAGVPNEDTWKSATGASVPMKEFREKGVAPTTACCACGGGIRAPTPFRYAAMVRPLLVGETVTEHPEPQTAHEYTADPGCDLHGLGLKLDATTGSITGVPKTEEPFQLSCTITAVEDLQAGVLYNATVMLDFAHFSYGNKALDFVRSSSKPVLLPEVEEAIPYSEMTATQSSTRVGGEAGRALTLSPQPTWPGTCTHTNPGEQEWWKVSLARPYEVSSIKLTNRADCCPERLQGVDVLVDGVACKSGVSVGAGATERIPCGLRGTEIKVQHQGQSLLTMCGFTAYGKKAYPPTYHQVLVASSCDDKGWETVDTESECEAAAEALGFPHEGRTIKVRHDSADRPAGCILYTNSGSTHKLEFNSNLGSTFTDAGSTDLFAICKSHEAYDDWEVACTPDAPWLKIDSRGTLRRDGAIGKPFAAYCRVTARGAAGNHSHNVAVFLPQEWSSMHLADDSAPDVSVASLELTVGATPPKVRARSSTPSARLLPPIKYAVDCGADSAFDTVTGNVLLHMERAFTLDIKSGRIAGAPHPHLFHSCQMESRCSVHLDCKIYGILPFSQAALSADLRVSAYDNMCWSKVETGHFVPDRDLSGVPVDRCRSWCRLEKTCGAYSIQNGKCEGMRHTTTVGTKQTTFVKIRDCTRFSACLHITVAGEAWLSGPYCPTVARDGGNPFYTKAGVALYGYDSIHLQPWNPAREIWAPTACPSQTKWVLRRADPAEDYAPGETAYVELRGQVVGCIPEDISPGAFDEEKGATLAIANDLPSGLLRQNTMSVQAVPAAKECISPFDEVDQEGGPENEQAKKEAAKEEKAAEDDQQEEKTHKSRIFVFDDPNTWIPNDYYLPPCSCFNQHWAHNPFVHEDTWAKMPPGSNNRFGPADVVIVKGGFSCEPKHLLAVERNELSPEECKQFCVDTGGCNYFWYGEYSGSQVCRAYSACNGLYREINSHGELRGLPSNADACLVADPTRCWQEVKRREFLTHAPKTPACLFQELLVACDQLLLMGGHGVENCGRCEFNSVAEWQDLRPMPTAFAAGSVLKVSCADGWRGSEVGQSAQKDHSWLYCVDGQWLDYKGRGGLSHFQCEACIQASHVGLKTYIQSNKQETWFTDKVGKVFRTGDQDASNCLVPSLGDNPEIFYRKISFQDWNTPLPAGDGVSADHGEGFTEARGYGWRSQTGSPCHFPASSQAAFSADFAGDVSFASTQGTHELKPWRTDLTELFNAGGHFNGEQGRFYAPVRGVYHFSAQIRLDGTQQASWCRMIIAKNGAPNPHDGRTNIQGLPRADYYTITAAGTVWLEANDFVSPFLECWGDSSWTVQSESGFSGHLVRAGGSEMYAFMAEVSSEVTAQPSVWHQVKPYRDLAPAVTEASGFQYSNGKFVAPKTGYYLMDANVRLDGAGGATAKVLIALSGYKDEQKGLLSVEAQPGPFYTQPVHAVSYLKAGTVATVHTWNSASNYKIQSTTDFTGVFLGASIDGFSLGKNDDKTCGRNWCKITGWSKKGKGDGLFNQGGLHNGNVMSATKAGYYHFSAAITLQGAGGNYFRVVIARNDNKEIQGGCHSIQGSSHEGHNTISVTCNMYLSKGDTAAVYTYSHHDTNYVVKKTSSWHGYLITSGQSAEASAGNADPENICDNTRFEVNVPAGSYLVTLVYASATQELQTAGCRLEDYDAGAGVAAAGHETIRELLVQILDGKLTFEGEKASDCTGLSTLIVETADKAIWGDCNEGSWRMTPSVAQNGAYQLEFQASSTTLGPRLGTEVGKAGTRCLTDQGALAHCEAKDRKQLHSLDHLPVLIAKVTHWTTDQEFHGNCARGTGADVIHLTTHGRVSCPEGAVMRSLEFQPKAGCNTGNTHQYKVGCSAFIRTPTTTCSTRRTACAEITGDLANWRLDKFKLECPDLTVLQAFEFQTCGANSYQYEYTCCPVPGFGGCELQETDWSEGSGKTLEYLTDHKITCKVGEALRGFVLDSKVPVSEDGQGEIRYLFVCCQVPLAAPVSMAHADLPLPGMLEGWEGAYCPSGSIEGRTHFAQQSRFGSHAWPESTLSYDMHGGNWCVGAGVCVHHSPAHPIALPAEGDAAFEVSPLAPFSGEFEGKGVKEYEEEPEEEEDGGGEGGLLPDKKPAKPKKERPKKEKKVYAAGDFTLDTNFVGTVTFAPWTPSDCDDTSNLPTEGGPNGQPTDRCYLAFCKARNEEGVETYDKNADTLKTALADEESKLSKERVGTDHPCYHAFDDPMKKTQTNAWDVTPPQNDNGPGITSDELYSCQMRQLKRNNDYIFREGDYEIVDGVMEFGSSIADLGCDFIPDPLIIIAPLGIGAGASWGLDDICTDIFDVVFDTAQFINHMEMGAKEHKLSRNNVGDCDAVAEGLQRVLCDLYCIEDAVKKGDKAILDTIGNLYEKIKLTSKEMFDFYIGQVLGKMGQLETSMYTRFDGITDEIFTLGEEMHTRFDETEWTLTDQIATNREELGKTLDKGNGILGEMLDEFKGYAKEQVKAQKEAQKKLLLPEMRVNLTRLAAATSGLYHETLQQVQRGALSPHAVQELRNLEAHVGLQATKVRQEAASSEPNPSLGSASQLAGQLAEQAEAAQERARWANVAPGAVQEAPGLAKRAALQSDQGLKIVLRLLEVSQGHAATIQDEVRRSIARQVELSRKAAQSLPGAFALAGSVLKGQELLAEEMHAASVNAMLVEFDKQWVALTDGVSTFLDGTKEFHAVAARAAEAARAYTECHSSRDDYDSLLVQYRALQVKRRSSVAALRSSFKELQRRLTLLADVLVDGGLFRTQVALTAAALPTGAAGRLAARAAGAGSGAAAGPGEARHLFTTEGIAAVQDEVLASLHDGLPPQLLGQTQAAFALADHMVLWHRNSGLREEDAAVQAMKSAWANVAAEYEALKSMLEEPTKDDTALGRRLVAAALDTLLVKLAAPPAGCESEGEEGAGSVVWAELEVASGGAKRLLLLQKPGVALLGAAGPSAEAFWQLPLAKSTDLQPRICEGPAGGGEGRWSSREVSADDRLTLCGPRPGGEGTEALPCSFVVDTATARSRSMNVSFISLGASSS